MELEGLIQRSGVVVSLHRSICVSLGGSQPYGGTPVRIRTVALQLVGGMNTKNEVGLTPVGQGAGNL